MAEEYKQLQAAAVLRDDELGAVLASLGPHGDGSDRLAAVVALLANADCPAPVVRGAFAGFGSVPTQKVTEAFTSALHSCLREDAVNAPSPANASSV